MAVTEKESNELPLPIMYHISPLFNDTDKQQLDPSTTAMIILNAPIRRPPTPLFDRLWEKSSLHICADGGANRLYKATVVDVPKSKNNDNGDNSKRQQQQQQQQVINPNDSYRPDLITGDLDSLQPVTRAHYESLKVEIVKRYDQNYNDLDKSIQSIPNSYKTCFVYGAFGGRLDQEMASLQALYCHASGNDSKSSLQQIWLYSDQNAALLLAPAVQHEIACPNFGDNMDKDSNNKPMVLGEGPTCGLIPVGQPCASVTTKGLKWDLNGQPLAFGALVSTSNRIVADVVQVTCSHPLLFTAEVHCGIPITDGEGFW